MQRVWLCCYAICAIGCSPSATGEELLDVETPVPGEGHLDLGIMFTAIEGSALEGATDISLMCSRIDVVHRTELDDRRTERVLTVRDDGLTFVVRDLAAQIDRPLLLTRLTVPVGFVTQIRLVKQTGDSIHVNLDGEQQPIRAPSAHGTGLKLVRRDGANAFEIVDQGLVGVLATLAVDRDVKENPQGLTLKPAIAASPIPPGDLVPLEPTTPSMPVARFTTAELEVLNRAPIVSAAASFERERIAIVDSPDVTTIVRGTVSTTVFAPTIERDGVCRVATIVTMAVDETFVAPVGPSVDFFVSGGGVLPPDPPPGCPRASGAIDPIPVVGDEIQVVLMSSVRNNESALILFGGGDGLTPLEPPAGSAPELADAITAVLAHTEATRARF